MRDPLPGSFRLEGAIGKSVNRVNGIFEPTKESQNGFPVYKKKGENDTWVEMVFLMTLGWCWDVKPTSSKGPHDNHCYAYFQCDEANGKLPQDCRPWHVMSGDGFKQEETCVASLASTIPLPPDVISRFQDGLNLMRKKKEERIAEVG